MYKKEKVKMAVNITTMLEECIQNTIVLSNQLGQLNSSNIINDCAEMTQRIVSGIIPVYIFIVITTTMVCIAGVACVVVMYHRLHCCHHCQRMHVGDLRS